MERTTDIRKPLQWHECYRITDAHCHNLKHMDVTFSKGVLTAVTGVSGSGKSSLMCYEFPRAYPQAIVIDQKPVGTSICSMLATYTGVMDEIRKEFADANKVTADWIIDMRSDGGSSGGTVVFEGTPERILECDSSKTGRFLSGMI